eukprot:9675681-Karenia_brevis.AAC.1
MCIRDSISTGEKGGQWQRVVPLLDEMRRRGLSPNVINFSAVMSVCEKGGQQQRVVPLLKIKMCREGLTPNVISFNAAISAYD